MPDLESPTLESLSARLDRQAAAIKALRVEVKTLKEAAAGARPSTETAPVQGTYVYSPLCVICGTDKAGRTTLTCADCGRLWMDGIKGLSERINFHTCCNCGAAKPSSTKMLCAPCSGSFRVWKAQH